MTNATDTHSEYLIIDTFPRQQFLRMRTRLMLRLYLRCLSCLFNQKVRRRGQNVLPLDTALSTMHIVYSLSIDVSNTNFNDNLPVY